MLNFYQKTRILNGNFLKIFAALTMLVDHIGMILFPQIKIFRILGRLAFPIFAFMISEGFKYTKNKARYFLTISILGIFFQLVYSIVTKSFVLNILLTFSVSIILLITLQEYKRVLFCKKSTKRDKIQATFLFIITYLLFFILNEHFIFDYGVFGCLLPVFASLFNPIDIKILQETKVKNTIKLLNLIPFSIGLIILSFAYNNSQFFSLLSLFPLFLYSGNRGKIKMKYFFYIFYPLHFVMLYLISLLI